MTGEEILTRHKNSPEAGLVDGAVRVELDCELAVLGDQLEGGWHAGSAHVHRGVREDHASIHVVCHGAIARPLHVEAVKDQGDSATSSILKHPGAVCIRGVAGWIPW